VPSQPLDIVVRLHDRSSLLQSVRQQISLARSREEELAFVLLRIVEPARSDAAARFGDDFEGGNRGLMLALRECIREWDVAGRLSADRLALVLPRCDERLARRIAARLRTAVGARTCNEVEVDVAIRLFPRDGATAEALLELQHATVAERVAVS
jgi:PleD family two-component response regulator